VTKEGREGYPWGEPALGKQTGERKLFDLKGKKLHPGCLRKKSERRQGNGKEVFLVGGNKKPAR